MHKSGLAYRLTSIDNSITTPGGKVSLGQYQQSITHFVPAGVCRRHPDIICCCCGREGTVQQQQCKSAQAQVGLACALILWQLLLQWTADPEDTTPTQRTRQRQHTQLACLLDQATDLEISCACRCCTSECEHAIYSKHAIDCPLFGADGLGTCRVALGIPINGHLVAMVLVGTKKAKRKHIQMNKPISLPTHFTDSRIDICANTCRGHPHLTAHPPTNGQPLLTSHLELPLSDIHEIVPP